jgi:hypothetical protein
MDIGKLFKDAWGLFTKDVGPLMVGMLIASFIPVVVVGVILVVTILPSLSGFTTDSSGTVTHVSAGSWALIGVGAGLAVIAAILVSIPLYAGILQGVLRRVREGRPMGYTDSFGGFRLFGRVVPAVLLLVVIFVAIELVPLALIVAAGVARSWIIGAVGALVMAAAVVAMIYLQIGWVYLFPLIVDQDHGVVMSLGESRRLVHGTGWWMTFVALLVMYLAAVGASIVLGLVPFVGSLAATIVVYPLMLTYVTSMYFRSRGEDALVDAATVPVGSWQPTGAPPYSQEATPYTPPAAPPAPPVVPPAPGQPAQGGAGAPQQYAPQQYTPPPPLMPAGGPDETGTAAGGVTPAAHEVPPAQPAAPEAPPAPPPPPGAST